MNILKVLTCIGGPPGFGRGGGGATVLVISAHILETLRLREKFTNNNKRSLNSLQLSYLLSF